MANMISKHCWQHGPHGEQALLQLAVGPKHWIHSKHPNNRNKKSSGSPVPAAAPLCRGSPTGHAPLDQSRRPSPGYDSSSDSSRPRTARHGRISDCLPSPLRGVHLLCTRAHRTAVSPVVQHAVRQSPCWMPSGQTLSHRSVRTCRGARPTGGSARIHDTT